MNGRWTSVAISFNLEFNLSDCINFTSINNMLKLNSFHRGAYIYKSVGFWRNAGVMTELLNTAK